MALTDALPLEVLSSFTSSEARNAPTYQISENWTMRGFAIDDLTNFPARPLQGADVY